MGECYNGDDCYLGPYLGQACHVGLDVNHEKGSILAAPITFDTHGYFNSLAAGDNNNRWRGIRRWPNGDVWALQTHHLIDLLVQPGGRLARGVHYATTAGVHVGSHEHTHFEFKIGRPRRSGKDAEAADANSIARPIDFDDQSRQAQEDPEVLHLDPWIVFWKVFQDARVREGKTRAEMQPLAPGRTGEPLEFAATDSRSGRTGQALECYWTFGDGGCERGATVRHVFAEAGVYPVTLVVDDGVERAEHTQHISISGPAVEGPVLALTAEDEPSFRPRPVSAADTYGQESRELPHTVDRKSVV